MGGFIARPGCCEFQLLLQLYALLFSACLKEESNLLKQNALSPHCPCWGPPVCCWAAPDCFSCHRVARRPYWPVLHSTPAASWVTIHHGTLRKQNAALGIRRHLNHVRPLISAGGGSFAHRALTDPPNIKKEKKKENNLKTWLHGNKISIQCQLTCPPNWASQSMH